MHLISKLTAPCRESSVESSSVHMPYLKPLTSSRSQIWALEPYSEMGLGTVILVPAIAVWGGKIKSDEHKLKPFDIPVPVLSWP